MECMKLREINSLRKLIHPNIIKLKEVLPPQIAWVEPLRRDGVASSSPSAEAQWEHIWKETRGKIPKHLYVNMYFKIYIYYGRQRDPK